MGLLAKAGSRFSFGDRAWTEMEIQFVKGMYRLKLVSYENSGCKGSNSLSFMVQFDELQIQ